MSKYLLYPGCSMETSAKAYNDSLIAVAKPMGLELEEIDDWNCCGASSAHSLNRRLELLRCDRISGHQPDTGLFADQP